MSDFTLDTVVIGGGQAGLAMGYFLAQQRRSFVILDAGRRVGDAWRGRWDSLRLFTQAGISGLPGLPFPAPGRSFPGKEAVAAYLAGYADHFALPVRLGRRVDALRRHEDGFLVRAGAERYAAPHVVVATGPFHHPRIPAFAAGLDPAIPQLHSTTYRAQDQLPPGPTLVVGAGNSGAEIAVELAATRRTFLAGRDTGHLHAGHVHNHLVLWLAERLLTTDTRLGRKAREASRRGAPLIRLTPGAIAAAGVERVPRVAGSAGGRLRLADGRVLDVSAVVWATGYRPDFRWIDLPIFDAGGDPAHHRGVVGAAPGLYFLGLPFQHTPTSTHIGGVGKDARYLARHLAARAGTAPGRRTASPVRRPGAELT